MQEPGDIFMLLKLMKPGGLDEQDNLYHQLYEEIERMQPVFKVLLAGKMKRKAEGMSQLRASVSQLQESSPVKSLTELDAAAQKFYDWLDPQKRSAIRMCMHWQVVL